MKCFIMIGVPGSGKSYIAEKISKVYDAVTASADAYRMRSGSYVYNPKENQNAHDYSKTVFAKALKENRNVIVDNTNVTLWEMSNYIDIANKKGYEVYIVESNAPWKFNAEECAKLNQHNVPLETIQKMMKSWMLTRKILNITPVEELGIL